MWSGCSRQWQGVAVVLLGISGIMGSAWPAETQSLPVTSKTQLVVKLATGEVLPVRSRFEPDPPTLIVEFPPGRVSGTLPERSMVRRGVIEEIQSVYASATKPGETRWLKALKIRLRGSYDFQVHAEPGRIIIELQHPAAMASEDVEVGLSGGTVISATLPPAFSERFRAMQEALDRARPQSWVWRARSAPATPPLPSSTRPEISSTSSQTSPSPTMPARGAQTLAGWLGLLGGIGFAGGVLWLWRRRVWGFVARRTRVGQPPRRAPSGVRLIDQLVWRAFERQSYQLLQTVELGDPLGLLRIMAKDGLKAALLCVGEGALFEKATVEQFLQSIRKAQVEHGFLVAPGSFTVPAQRYAKEHGIVLLGREQLTQLLSDGAISESYTDQLQQLHKQLEDAQEALSESARQLDTIRRQRNEASWFLGEERAKTAKLEAQVNELNEQFRHWQTQAEQWQQTADATRKQWEESQWYLGEARAFGRHVDEQLRALHGEGQRLLAELIAMRTYGDRRRAFRVSRPQVTIEVQRPDGVVVFRGIPRNLSRTGFGFDAEQLLDHAPDFLRIRLYPPESEQAVEATGRLVWQRRDATMNGHALSGCEFLDMAAEGRATLEQILTRRPTS